MVYGRRTRLIPKFKTTYSRQYQEMFGDKSGKRIDRQYFCWIIASNGLEGLYSKCCACGWDDGVVDLAHKLPAKQGGSYTVGNIVPLCPNCHRLFDIFRLSNNKTRKINDFSREMRRKFKKGLTIN